MGERYDKAILEKICGLFFLSALVFLTSGCGNLSADEEKIKEDLVNAEANTIYISYNADDAQTAYTLDISAIEIDERNTRDTFDEITCTVKMENDAYSFDGTVDLTYLYDKKTGWTFDSYQITDGTITPTNGIPEDNADAEMKKYYFDDYKLSDSSYNQTALTSELTYTVSYDKTYLGYNGDVQLNYTFTQDGENTGTWSYTLDYLSDFDWKIAGTYACDLEEKHESDGDTSKSSDDLFQATIGDYDAKNGTVKVSSSSKYKTGRNYFTEGELDAAAKLDFSNDNVDYVDGSHTSTVEWNGEDHYVLKKNEEDEEYTEEQIHYDPPALWIFYCEKDSDKEAYGVSIYFHSDEAYMSCATAEGGGVLYVAEESASTTASSGSGETTTTNETKCLFDLPIYNTNDPHTYESKIEDTNGWYHEKCYTLWCDEKEDTNDRNKYIRWQLTKPYSTVNGTLYQKSSSPYATYWLEFYSGDNLIYTTDRISDDNQKVEFSFDVTGVEYLTMYCFCSSIWGKGIIADNIYISP